mmetsp:Transcript_520/g.583  ORF Transcript_520/g.583 Transcript_520/m.583 type:complete len:95 (+) Transcript_520:1088-1372(+)
MNIVWKKWKSDFVYKCQTGFPIADKTVPENRKDSIREIHDKDTIKFFLQFSSVSPPRELNDTETAFKQPPTFVSFIWIKGSSMKFLDFITHLTL